MLYFWKKNLVWQLTTSWHTEIWYNQKSRPSKKIHLIFILKLSSQFVMSTPSFDKLNHSVFFSNILIFLFIFLACGISVACSYVTWLDWIGNSNWSCSYQLLRYDVIALLHLLLFGMFFHQVWLEKGGSVAFVVTMVTSKRLLPGVRSRVLF